MRRSRLGYLALGLITLAIVTIASRPMWGADAPFAGTWKVTVFSGDEAVTLCLVKIESKGGKPEPRVIWTLPAFKEFSIEDFKAGDNSLHFRLKGKNNTFAVAAYTSAGVDGKQKKLFGSVGRDDQRGPMWMELTDKKKLTDEESTEETPGYKSLSKADDLTDAKEQEEALKEILKKYQGKAISFLAAQMLFSLKVATEAPTSEIRPAADRFIELASVYGREMKLQATWQVARNITRAGKEPRFGLGYARKAYRELDDGDSKERQSAVLKVLVKALRQNKKLEELKEITPRLDKLEDHLDQDFARRSVPFKTTPYAGRKGKSDRVVVVELFTGAYCPPCVGADVAFDALLKTYKPSDVILLQYHLHIPRPDPLTNAEGVARGKFYEAEGTPSVYLDGEKLEGVGGSVEDGKESFDNLSQRIEKDLDRPAAAQIKLAVKRTGDRIDMEARVSELKKTGKEVRLRFVLVEDVVRFPGGNGQRLHHHVVRALPGGEQGFALNARTETQTVRVTLSDLRKGLDDYLTTAGKKRSFPDDDRPLGLQNLKVVALVQDDKSKEILQAAQADVPAEAK